MKVAYIDQYKETFGVQPICDALDGTDAEIAPSTYYAAGSRPPSTRSRRDEELTEEIHRIHTDNYGVYGARKQRVLPRCRHPLGSSRDTHLTLCDLFPHLGGTSDPPIRQEDFW